VEGELGDKIRAEFEMNFTNLSNIISTKPSLKGQFELSYVEKPTLNDNLKIFREVGVITTKDKI
jgi:hypothetical protein